MKVPVRFDLSAGAGAFNLFHRWDWLYVIAVSTGVLLFWSALISSDHWNSIFFRLAFFIITHMLVQAIGLFLVVVAGPSVFLVGTYSVLLTGWNYPSELVIDSNGVAFRCPRYALFPTFRPLNMGWEDKKFSLTISDARCLPSTNPTFAILARLPRRPPAVLTEEAFETLKSEATQHGLEVRTGKRTFNPLTLHPRLEEFTTIRHFQSGSQDHSR